MALLVAQLVLLYQAALRGSDYRADRTLDEVAGQGLSIVDAASPLEVWGWLFYGSAVLALIGLALRSATIVVTAHALLFCWYGGIGIGVLQSEGIDISPPVVAGGVLAAAGTWLVFRQDADRALIRLLVGVPAMLLGQEMLASGLGVDYRTGTGLLGAAVLHLTIGAGTWLMATRQQLAAQVAKEQRSSSSP